MEIHRILCQCKRCGGKKENKYYLQLKEFEEKGYFVINIKGLIFEGVGLIIKEQDIINCLNNMKKSQTTKERKR